MKLAGKVVLITGGGSGIGRAAAQVLVAEGAKVVVSDVNVEGGEETVHDIRANGGGAVFVQCDVSKAAEVEALVAETLQTYGRLDYSVNSAGVGGDMLPTDRREESAWDLMMNVNLKGVWLCMKYEIGAMLRTGGGAIVNTSSNAALLAVPTQSAYCAAKAGVIGLTRNAAIEYAAQGIRANTICPGLIMTPAIAKHGDVDWSKQVSIPLGRPGQPGEVGELMAWLCSPRASFGSRSSRKT